MSHFDVHAKFYDNPVFLNREEMNDPFIVLYDFFKDYRLSELRQYISNILDTCLTTDNTFFMEPEERANLIYRIRQFERILEAIRVITLQKRKGT